MDPEGEHSNKEQEVLTSAPTREESAPKQESETDSNEDVKQPTETKQNKGEDKQEQLQTSQPANPKDLPDTQPQEDAGDKDGEAENAERDLESLLSSDEDLTFIDKDKVLAMFAKITKDNIQKMCEGDLFEMSDDGQRAVPAKDFSQIVKSAPEKLTDLLSQYSSDNDEQASENETVEKQENPNEEPVEENVDQKPEEPLEVAENSNEQDGLVEESKEEDLSPQEVDQQEPESLVTPNNSQNLETTPEKAEATAEEPIEEDQPFEEQVNIFINDLEPTERTISAAGRASARRTS